MSYPGLVIDDATYREEQEKVIKLTALLSEAMRFHEAYSLADNIPIEESLEPMSTELKNWWKEQKKINSKREKRNVC